MIEMLAAVELRESVASPGWFLVHAIGVGMSVVGLIFSWVQRWEWSAFPISTPGCMQPEKEIPYPPCSCSEGLGW